MKRSLLDLVAILLLAPVGLVLIAYSAVVVASTDLVEHRQHQPKLAKPYAPWSQSRKWGARVRRLIERTKKNFSLIDLYCNTLQAEPMLLTLFWVNLSAPERECWHGRKPGSVGMPSQPLTPVSTPEKEPAVVAVKLT